MGKTSQLNRYLNWFLIDNAKKYKAKPGDYPAYTDMYMTLLSDDGNVLLYLANKYKK